MMNAKRLPPTGDAEMWVITDDAGNKHRVVFPDHTRNLSDDERMKLAMNKVRGQPHG